MTEQSVETDASTSKRRNSRASAYSACIQEAMRFDRLPSSDYQLVMTILHAILQGHSEERWQEDNQRTIQQLHQLAPERRTNHADEVDRYAQTVSCLKDLLLWPW